MKNDNLNEIKSQLKTLTEAELHGLNSAVFLEIKTRAYNEGYTDGLSWGYEDKAVETPIVPKTPQQIRDEIIEEAKRDVADLIFEHMLSADEFRFVVNKEKRTIVALDLTFKPARKGITKCDPTDCFNVHIGKAIAVRRALGLEVPTEYLNAPQPTEVRVGDVVQSLMSGNIGTKVASKKGEHTLVTKGIYYTLAHSVCNVIDDSREGGEE
jgi:hypothetical protein